MEVLPEDEGTFHCSAQNPAGVATANLTLIVVPRGHTGQNEGVEGLGDVGGAQEGGGGGGDVGADGGSVASDALEEKEAEEEDMIKVM